ANRSPRTSHGWPTAPGSTCPGASTVWKERTVMAATDLELTTAPTHKPTDALAEVVVYFAGDSGDGIQAIGGQFGHTSVRMGNDIVTFPDFPAEIRAPAGTRAGVSGYQLRFGNSEVLTPGDGYDALVAFNPAALLTRLKGLKTNGILIANSD